MKVISDPMNIDSQTSFDSSSFTKDNITRITEKIKKSIKSNPQKVKDIFSLPYESVAEYKKSGKKFPGALNQQVVIIDCVNFKTDFITML